MRIYEEAKALRSLGIDVRIVTYHLGRTISPIPTYRTCPIPWYKKREAGPSWHKPYLDLLLFFKALQICKSFAPDLIHAHLHEGALVGFMLKKLLKVPLLFDYQGSMTTEVSDHGFTGKQSALLKVFAIVEDRINRAADFIITSSSPSADALVNTWKIPEGNVEALIDGVDTECFRPYGKTESRDELRLPVDVPVVAYLGLLNEYQGIDILLDAVARLKAQKRDLHFLIMGFPEEKYIEKSRQLNVASVVTFTGKIDYEYAPKYLSACDIAVSPKISRAEANGKIFNYMACGLPTVAFDTPVNREILGETGIFAEYGNAADLAEKIALLVADGQRVKSLSKQVREKAVHNHSWRARGERLLVLYNKLIR
ncbi:glycosyltransferase [Geotalea sp. SG265]|uniref:glycosyltransferase n=1 Tax=Geotalea sp. SG265 TaxID=2922867 RepID=UPI00325FC1E0